jgi:plasmid stabilization system protein ParE
LKLTHLLLVSFLHSESPSLTITKEIQMPIGDKSKYTDKQKRKAERIVKAYVRRGVAKALAKRRAWATVNKESGGGNLRGSGRGKKDTTVSSRRGGKIGGRSVSARKRSMAAKKAWRTRKAA